MNFADTLRRLSEGHMTALSERERRDFQDELDRLRMLRTVEDGLGLGDYLPDFELLDGEGRLWSSQALLDRGPLVLALFRGDWCPYCALTMAALEDARPAIEALGVSVVGFMPGRRVAVAETGKRRGLG
ncbi:MAG: redoxin domain-containing protein, partial [Alphaproteobacteria bacterium]|nr:redoxin domain-containing protein [Alphaproteobacteria bacterium]